MKAYPLIYSRTKNFDFVPDFLVRPQDLDVQCALKYVKNAINGLDFVKQIRYAFFNAGNYCICGGISCLSKKIVEELKNTIPDFSLKVSEYEDYLKDCKGRSVACFIGIAVPQNEITFDSVPDISLEMLWDIYIEYLKHQWNKEEQTESEQLTSPVLVIPTKKYIPKNIEESDTIGSIKAVRDFGPNKDTLLAYYSHTVINDRSASFISEINTREEWNSLSFTAAAVSATLYSSLKTAPSVPLKQSSLLKGNGEKSANNGDVCIRRTPPVTPPPPPQANIQKKKNSGSIIILLSAVAIILVILLIILMK